MYLLHVYYISYLSISLISFMKMDNYITYQVEKKSDRINGDGYESKSIDEMNNHEII